MANQSQQENKAVKSTAIEGLRMGVFNSASQKAENQKPVAISILPVGEVGAVVTAVYHLGDRNVESIKLNKDTNEYMMKGKVQAAALFEVSYHYPDDEDKLIVRTYDDLVRDHQSADTPLGKLISAAEGGSVELDFDIKDILGKRVVLETVRVAGGTIKKPVAAELVTIRTATSEDSELLFPDNTKLLFNYASFEEVKSLMGNEEGVLAVERNMPPLGVWYLTNQSIEFGSDPDIPEYTQEELAEKYETYSN